MKSVFMIGNTNIPYIRRILSVPSRYLDVKEANFGKVTLPSFNMVQNLYV